MINTKRFLIFVYLFPIFRDEISGKFVFIKPKFHLEVLKGTPCQTHWLYDWILSVGWITVMRKVESETKRLQLSCQSIA